MAHGLPDTVNEGHYAAKHPEETICNPLLREGLHVPLLIKLRAI